MVAEFPVQDGDTVQETCSDCYSSGDEDEQENRSGSNDEEIPNNLDTNDGWRALERESTLLTTSISSPNQYTILQEQPAKTAETWLAQSSSVSHLYPPDSSLPQLSTHSESVFPQINPQASTLVWSSMQIFPRHDGKNNTLKIMDQRRKHFVSNMFVNRGKRVKVSRRVRVTKYSSTPFNWEYPTVAEQTVDGKYEKLPTTNVKDNVSENSDIDPTQTEQPTEVISTTISNDLMAANNIFEQERIRNCSWHLDIEGSIGDFIFSTNNLDAAAIDDDNTVLGSEGFANGRHFWVIKASGYFCALGVCYPGKENIESSWYKGAKWVWTTDGLQYSEPKGIRRSDFGQWKSEDVLEIHLDCENSTVSVVNTTTNTVASQTGFTGKVYPYFNLYKASYLSLLETIE